MIKEAYNINLTVDKNIDWKKLQTFYYYMHKKKLYPYTIDTLNKFIINNIKLVLVS